VKIWKGLKDEHCNAQPHTATHCNALNSQFARFADAQRKKGAISPYVASGSTLFGPSGGGGKGMTPVTPENV